MHMYRIYNQQTNTRVMLSSSSSSSTTVMINIIAVLLLVLLIDGFTMIPSKRSCNYNNNVLGVSIDSFQLLNNNKNNYNDKRRKTFTNNCNNPFFLKNGRGGGQHQYSETKCNADTKVITDNEITDSTQETVSTLSTTSTSTTTSKDDIDTSEDEFTNNDYDTIFNNFVSFIIQQQTSIINEIESTIEAQSQIKFSKDCWGVFDDNNNTTESSNKQLNKIGSGGITRVIQGGNVIEKGACSITVLRNGTLTVERAVAIQSRQPEDNTNKIQIQAGDIFYAAALSIVFHTKSPYIPTFRSDVRIFIVKSSSSLSTNNNNNNKYSAWFGGGADLTPYYSNNKSFTKFHMYYKQLCTNYPILDYSYEQMKIECDKYFYVPCRNEHRGIGGIFFDNMNVTLQSYNFIKNLVQSTWLPSWISSCIYITDTTNENDTNTIIDVSKQKYTKQEKDWQCLRRGRYLEFNLLYDRGVKFGLLTNNPRVEGVMVSAPPEIQYYYNYPIIPNSREDKMIQLLKNPINWI